MDQILIRKAEQKDAAAIAELSHGLFLEDGGQRDPYINTNWPVEEGEGYFSAVIGRPKHQGWIAEKDGKAIGYLVGYVEEPGNLRPVSIAELESMFVRAEYRGQGIGEQLARRFFAYCREQGAERMSVTAFAANMGAIRFYQRLGFVPFRLTQEMAVPD